MMHCRPLYLAIGIVLALSATVSAFGTAAAGEEGQNLALCVGINQYSRMGALRYCANDARAIKRRLDDSGTFRRVKVLTDVDEKDAPVAVSGLPTANNILANLKQLASLASPDGSLLFYFSGHGVEREGVHYLVPVDGDETAALAMDDVRGIMAKSRARNKLIILDACRSGLGAKGLAGVRGTLEEEGLGILVSCGEDQFSYEIERSERSLFSLILEEGLSGKADLDGDNVISGGELHRFLDRAMGDYCLDNDILAAQTPAINEAGREIAFLTIDPGVLAAREREREEKLAREKAEARRLEEENRRRRELEARQEEERKVQAALQRAEEEARRREAEARRKQEEERRNEDTLYAAAVDAAGCDAYLARYPYGRHAEDVRRRLQTYQFDMTGSWFITVYAPPNPRTGAYDMGFTHSARVTRENGVYVWRDVPNSYRAFGGGQPSLGNSQWSFTYTYANNTVTITDLNDGDVTSYVNTNGKLVGSTRSGGRLVFEKRGP